MGGPSGPLDGAVIDEVQRVPELLLAIKLVVDDRRRPGRFLLTGSADVPAPAGTVLVHKVWGRLCNLCIDEELCSLAPSRGQAMQFGRIRRGRIGA